MTIVSEAPLEGDSYDIVNKYVLLIETFEIRCRSEIFVRTIVYFESTINLRSKHSFFFWRSTMIFLA